MKKKNSIYHDHPSIGIIACGPLGKTSITESRDDNISIAVAATVAALNPNKIGVQTEEDILILKTASPNDHAIA